MGQRRRFTPEFKRQAVQLLTPGNDRLPRLPVSSALLAIGSTNGRKKWRVMAAPFLAQAIRRSPLRSWPR